MLLIDSEIELELKWTKKFIISEISRTFRTVDPNASPVMYEFIGATTGASFQTDSAKFYVSVFTLCINDNIKFY